jgi:O-antigen ligase
MVIIILPPMKSITRARTGEWALLLLLSFSILWKGGKSLEATWLLTGCASGLTVLYWLLCNGRKRDEDRQLELKQGLSVQRSEIPLAIWIISMLYIAWSILSYMFSETRNYGLDEILRTGGYVLTFLWIARMRIEQQSTAIERLFPVVISVSTVLAGIFGIAVYSLQPVNRFVGTFFDYRFHTDYWPNAWAQFLLIAWPMILLLAWRQKNEKLRWAIFASLGFVLSTLLLSYSRGAMLSFGGQCAVMLVLFSSVIVRDIRYRRAAGRTAVMTLIKAAAVSAIAVALFFAVNQIRMQTYDVQSVSEKVTFTAAEGTSSINERAQFWKQAYKLALERPLVGWGPYSFRFIQPELMQHVLATSDHAHNILLKLSMERGFPAAGFFAALFGSTLFMGVISFFMKRKAISPDKDALSIACIASIAGLLLHNMIDYNLQFTGVGLGAVITLGLLVPPVTSSVSGAASFRQWRIRRLLLRTDLLVALLLFFIAAWEGVFLVTSSLGRHALAGGDMETASTWFARSHGAMFSRDLYLSEAQIALEQREYEEADAALDRYEEVNAVDSRLWRMRADLLQRTGKIPDAQAALQTAYDKGKYTDLTITRMLLESLKTGDAQLLSGRKLEFDALFAAYAEAIENNTHFIALSQNVEELEKVAELLAQIYPVDAERYDSIARSAAEHAKKERKQYTTAGAGILW